MGKEDQERNERAERGVKEGCSDTREIFQVPSFAVCLQPKACAVTQSARDCWQPAQSWHRSSLRSCQLCRGLDAAGVPPLGLTECRHHHLHQRAHSSAVKAVRLQHRWKGGGSNRDRCGSGESLHTAAGAGGAGVSLSLSAPPGFRLALPAL